MAKYFKAKNPIYAVETQNPPQYLSLSVDYHKDPRGTSGYRATVSPVIVTPLGHDEPPHGPALIGMSFDREYFTYYEPLSLLLVWSDRRNRRKEAEAKQWAREHEADLVQGYINGVKALGGRAIELTGESWGEI